MEYFDDDIEIEDYSPCTIFECAMSYMEGEPVSEGRGLKHKDWKDVGKEYKYRDRYKTGFHFRNMGSIMKNIMSDKSESYASIRPNLLKMVSKCKSQNDIEYLRRDINAAMVQLNALKRNKPERTKAIDEQIEWIKIVYRPAINEKAKELRKAEGWKDED